ncbi:MAG: hypothetical protein WAM75_11645 [Xanthobacteraceae bacterium]
MVTMPWYYYVAHFFAGVFLANGVPHFVHGISGNKFQSPFASPPGVGESSAIVNVVWGWFNFVIAGALVFAAFPPLPPPIGGCIAGALGVLASSLCLAHHFGRVRRAQPSP